MKNNAAAPYYLIGILGILAMIIMGGVGMAQMDFAEDSEGPAEEEAASEDPEAIYNSNCMSCHGGDLEGGMGPELQNVADRYSAEEIFDIINNGIDGTVMTGDYATEAEAEVLTEWLTNGEE